MASCSPCLLLALSALLAVSVTSLSPCGHEPTIIQDRKSRFPAGCSWESLTGDNKTIVQGCDSKVTCLWKCCPQGQTLNSRNKCTSDDHVFSPRFNISTFHILTGNPCSSNRFRLEEEEISNIEDNGMLTESFLVGGGKSSFSAGGYCLGEFKNGTFFKTVALVCEHHEDERTQLEEERRDDVTFLIYTIGRMIALPFLIATVAVYAVIPELRNLHGKCLVSHVTSLSVAYVFLIVVALGGGDGLAKWVCVSSALIIYFFMLGSFFWLNVMCFDIWWTFSGHRRVIGSKGSNEQREFVFYSLYAWGAPVVVLCVTLILEFGPNVPDSYVKPQFGVAKCWFKDKLTVLAYFSGPVAFLIVANIVFFAVTAMNIIKIRRQTSVLTNSDSRRNERHKSNEQRFVLYLKLFVVMGVTWSLDLIGWAIGGPDYIWWVTDLANILQGVLIFVIFVWKARVRRLLRQRFNCEPLQNSISPTGSTEVMGSYNNAP